MKIKEYEAKMKELLNEQKRERDKLKVSFAMSNCKYGIGDTLKSNAGVFVVDKIITVQYVNLEASYCGYQLTKKMTQRKDKRRIQSTDYQLELIEKLY